MLLFGLVFVVAGLAFKLGVVPFHMGCPTSTTVPRPRHADDRRRAQLAAFGIVMRLLVEGLLPLVWTGSRC